MKNKKLIGEILFLLLVFGATVYMVFRGEDLKRITLLSPDSRRRLASRIAAAMACDDSGAGIMPSD